MLADTGDGNQLQSLPGTMSCDIGVTMEVGPDLPRIAHRVDAGPEYPLVGAHPFGLRRLAHDYHHFCPRPPSQMVHRRRHQSSTPSGVVDCQRPHPDAGP